MKRPKFSAERLYKPTREAQIENIKRFNEYDRLGIEIVFSEGMVYTPDELEAIQLITSHKKLPADLEQRLLKTKKSRLSRFKSVPVQKISDEEIRDILGLEKF
ncbi:MAG: hypothetical protein NC548_47445 [Lachnospiraceae bacterium]|nr:hypothetical protein [Lachnospiraceae bacterium]